MKLNYNSVSANIYRWFYSTTNMPSNLCPYFWRWLIMWILIIPYSLLVLPYYIFNRRSDPHRGERPFFGLLFYIGLALGLSMILSAIHIFTPIQFPLSLTTLIDIGNCIWTVLVISLFARIVDFIKSKIFHKKNPSVQRSFGSSLIIEYIKSTYNKSCPRIDWIRK